jgi:magnesium-transporting ATPase (P-type)
LIEIANVAALWWAVIFSGVYHGVNPGMGWPLAVSAGLMESKTLAMPKALAFLSLGHFVAMITILLPFSIVIWLIDWEKQLRVGAGVIVLAMGAYLLINRKHPRYLARVHPAKLGLWSFLAAMAHGAGLMLLPIYLGICNTIKMDTVLDGGHEAARQLMSSDISMAFLVSIVHTLAMTAAGAAVAVFVYFWFGLKFIAKSWFNLDLVWALSLIFVGSLGIYSAIDGHY